MKPVKNQENPAIYQIKLKGSLDPCWAEWFDGMVVSPQKNGETLLIGKVRDQAALHGVLVKIRDMGLPLLSVNRADPASLTPDMDP